LVGADTSDNCLIDAVSRFHCPPAGSRIAAVTLDTHGSGQAGAVAIQVKFPPSVIAPISIFIIPMPYPVLLPPRPPNTPICRAFYRSVRNSGDTVAVVAVIGYGIRRRIFVKINDFYIEGGFGGASGTGYRHMDCQCLLSIRGFPFYPRKLTVSFRIINITHVVGSPTDIKADTGGPVGVGLTAADSDCRNDIRIHTVLIIVGVNLRFLRPFCKTDNAKPKAGLDVRIRSGACPASSPCGITEITYFKKHGEGQILMSKGHHTPP